MDEEERAIALVETAKDFAFLREFRLSVEAGERFADFINNWHNSAERVRKGWKP